MVIWSGKAWKSSAPGGGAGNIGTIEIQPVEDDMTDFITGTEVDTGDTLDGSTIYAKVLEITGMPNNGSKSQAHGITGIDKRLAIYAVIDDGTNTWEWGNSGATWYSNIRYDATNIVVSTDTNWSSYDGRFVLFYTKV